MSTTGQESKQLARIFKGRRERIRPYKKCAALRAVKISINHKILAVFVSGT